jgi:DNA-binding PadR family transcriptional regulator
MMINARQRFPLGSDVGIVEIRYRNSIFAYRQPHFNPDAEHTQMSGTDKDLYSGLIRLHVLHHAAEHPIYGSWMIEELREHGYEISPGTLYPMLHGLARKEYLKVRQEGPGKRARRFYTITKQGRAALADAKGKVRGLFGELFESNA